jgi:hypothetical protein
MSFLGIYVICNAPDNSSTQDILFSMKWLMMYMCVNVTDM